MTGPGRTSQLQWLPHAVLWIGGLGTVIGAAGPGIALFTEHRPPMFVLSTLLGLASTVFVVLLVFLSSARRRDRRIRALIAIFAAIALAVAYEILLGLVTVRVPDDQGGGRIQVGFGLTEWSLTGFANERIQEINSSPEHEILTPFNAMMALGGFEDGPQIIWRIQTIVEAGLLLFVLFLGAFVLWTYGFAVFAKEAALQLRGTGDIPGPPESA